MDTSLIEKILSGTATNLEIRQFEKWLSETEAHSIHFEQVKLIWDKSKIIPKSISFDEEIAKNKIRNRIYQDQIFSRKAKIRRTWIAAAASILILLGIGTLAHRHEWIGLEKTIEYCAQGSVKEISLPDGSIVWLNANSTLIAPEKFNGKKRNIKLKGEAYFEVARDESRPFIIQTGKTVTKVLGTSFNIKMDSILENVSVMVKTGKVAFSQLQHEKEGVILLAGDMANFTFQNGLIQKDINHDLNYLAWKTHILTFQSAPLKEVCKVLADYYKQSIITNLTDGNYVITGKFEKEDLEDILATIKLTLNINVKQDNNQIIIYQ